MVAVFDLSLPGVKRIRLDAFPDDRGFFSEIFRKKQYKEMGIDADFVQDNFSFSKKGTIRGMHFQTYPGQAKLITALSGVIYDVFVDIRKESPNFGKWGSYTLDAKNHEQIFIPSGFAHGFAVLSDEAHVIYKVSSVFNPETEMTFRFDDPQLSIKWPVDDPILSEKDRNASLLKEVL